MPFGGKPFRHSVTYDYQNSEPLDEALYDNEDFLFNVRPRTSTSADVTDEACFEVRNIWKHATGKEHRGTGCMDPVSGNFAALLFSEAPKDRLFALAFVNEFLFIQDDVVDAVDQSNVSKTVDQFSWEHGEVPDTAMKHKFESIKTVQGKVLSQLLDLDQVAGVWVLDEVKKFAEVQGLTRLFDFQHGTLDEYIEFRHSDLGTYFVCACIGFGVVPTISPTDVKHVLQTTKIGYACAMLCNDYWSWDKELKDFTGVANWPVSAVYLFMQQHNVDADTAKHMVKEKTMELAEQYGNDAAKWVEGLPADSPIVRWFALTDLMIAGNALWSMTSPRYHTERPQLSRDQVHPLKLDVDLILQVPTLSSNFTSPSTDDQSGESTQPSGSPASDFSVSDESTYPELRISNEETSGK